MTTRERMRLAMTGEGLPDRVPLCEISFWPETIKRWHKEGLPEGVDVIRWLGMDPIYMSGPDGTLMLTPEEISEDDTSRTVRNANGVVEKHWKTHTATPAPLEYLIQSADDWAEYKDKLAFKPERIPADYADIYQKAHAEDAWFAINPYEPIWWVLQTLGFERTFEALMFEPDLIEDMVIAQTELSLKIIDAVCEIGVPDALWYFSDLCYKNGMFFSPKLYRELIMPHIQRVTRACHERDIVTMYHCCGDQRPIIPLLIDAGFDCIQPIEARTGCDIREMKQLYGQQVTFMGNLSVERLSGAVAEAEEEVASKVSAAAQGGRYIFHSDHSVPPTVPLENFQAALAMAKRVGSYE